MSKCGKGCLPECQYFTTGGCISPFNCVYKIEEHNQNNVFTSGGANALSGIEKFFINTVKSGVLPQEPMNYDGAAMKAYISYLESENAALRARLEKAVDKELIAKKLAEIFGCICNFTPLDEEMWEYCGDNCVDDDKVCWERFITKAAEARLAELKGRKQ